MNAEIRAAHPTDQAFIANSWASTLLGPRSGWTSTGLRVNAQIDTLLDDKRTKLLVACDPQSHDTIWGWLAFARVPGARVIEFVFVRRQRRLEGIASALLDAGELTGAGPPVCSLFNTRDWKQFRSTFTATPIEVSDFL